MIIDNVVLKLLENSTSKPKIEITWDNNQSSLCEIDTYYDTDNGLELDDEGYEEYHEAMVKEVINYIEIGWVIKTQYSYN